MKFDANFKEYDEKKMNPALKKSYQIFEKLKLHPKFTEFSDQILKPNDRSLDFIE